MLLGATPKKPTPENGSVSNFHLKKRREGRKRRGEMLQLTELGIQSGKKTEILCNFG